MVNFSLMGAGRIGKMHADIIHSNPNSNLRYVYDINIEASNKLANKYGALVTKTPEEALENSEIDAVLIASATPTHIEFIIKASKAGKAILCEKPIDLDIEKVNECRNLISGNSVPIQIGFNRRFDKNNIKLKNSKESGEIGNLEMIVITSRDPQPPSLEYLKASGGLFRDCTIHDFDLARFILGEDPVIKISTFATQLTSQDIKEIGDHDTSMFLLESKKGVLIHINNSRRAVYGYDQRVEIFGSKGMMISNNQTDTSVEKYTNTYTRANDLALPFFIERYQKAYINQFSEFLDVIKKNKRPIASFDDGRNALIIANAAYKSLENKKSVDISFE